MYIHVHSHTKKTILISTDLRAHTLRAYDAVQLTSALITNETLQRTGQPALIFLSADERLLEAAHKENLPTDNPNLHPWSLFSVCSPQRPWPDGQTERPFSACRVRRTWGAGWMNIPWDRFSNQVSWRIWYEICPLCGRLYGTESPAGFFQAMAGSQAETPGRIADCQIWRMAGTDQRLWHKGRDVSEANPPHHGSDLPIRAEQLERLLLIPQPP